MWVTISRRELAERLEHDPSHSLDRHSGNTLSRTHRGFRPERQDRLRSAQPTLDRPVHR